MIVVYIAFKRFIELNSIGHLLWRYVFHFRPEPINEINNYLFLTLDGKKLIPNAIKLLLKRWGKKAGVPRLPNKNINYYWGKFHNSALLMIRLTVGS